MRFAFWITEGTDTHSEYVKFIFYGNNGYVKAPQCCVITTLRVLLKLFGAFATLWSILQKPIRLTFDLSIYMCKGKAVPLQAWTGPEGSRNLRFPDFVTTAQDGGRLSA